MDMMTTCAVRGVPEPGEVSRTVPPIAVRALAEARSPLDAAAAAFRGYAPDELRLRAAHNAAEAVVIVLRKTLGTPRTVCGVVGHIMEPPYPPEYETALNAGADADEAWQAALDRLDELAQAILAAPVDSIADAQRKQALYAQLEGGRFSTKHPMEEDQIAAALEAARRDLEALAMPKPFKLTEFDRIVAAHATAMQFYGEEGEDGAPPEGTFHDAEQALISTPATSTSGVAYKISAALLGADPDWNCLNSDTAAEWMANPEAASEHRLLASAFLDCYRFTPIRPFSAPASYDLAGAERAAWDQLRSELAEGKANLQALYDRGKVTDEEETALDRVVGRVEKRLDLAPAPDIKSMLDRMFEDILALGWLTHQSHDDLLAQNVGATTFETYGPSLAFLDLLHFAQRTGQAGPLWTDAFFPRSTNARLKQLGVTVWHGGFSAPDGFRSEALALMARLRPGETRTAFAAAWLDEFCAEGGMIHLSAAAGTEPRLAYDAPVPGSAELIKLTQAIYDREGGPSKALNLKREVERLGRSQLGDRDVDRWPRAAL